MSTIQKIVINIGPLPKRPERKKPKGGSRAPRKPAKMDWSCMSCKSMMCLEDGFHLELAKKEKRLPDICPLGDENFRAKVAVRNLIKSNAIIKEIRLNILALEGELTSLRRREASEFVFRHKQLGDYYKRVTITRVTEKKARGKKGKEMPLPNFKVTVSEVKIRK